MKKKIDMKDIYINSVSGHSRGSTIDLSIIDINKILLKESIYEERTFNGKIYPFNNDNTIDCGTSFDLMDPASWSFNNKYDFTEEQKNNRKFIRDIMERKYFNKKTKEETKSFLNSDIILEPQIIRREFSHTLKEGYQEIINDRDALIGDLIGSCDIKKSSQKYIITCKFKINLNESHNNICILVNQKIKEGDEPKDIFSLKLIKHDNNTLEFERQIETNNINFNTKNERLIETEILIFDVEPWEEEFGGENAEEQCV